MSNDDGADALEEARLSQEHIEAIVSLFQTMEHPLHATKDELAEAVEMMTKTTELVGDMAKTGSGVASSVTELVGLVNELTCRVEALERGGEY